MMSASVTVSVTEEEKMSVEVTIWCSSRPTVTENCGYERAKNQEFYLFAYLHIGK